jgi:hypothetical protein
VDPVPDPYFSENLVAPGIEPGTPGSVATFFNNFILFYNKKETATTNF